MTAEQIKEVYTSIGMSSLRKEYASCVLVTMAQVDFIVIAKAKGRQQSHEEFRLVFDYGRSQIFLNVEGKRLSKWMGFQLCNTIYDIEDVFFYAVKMIEEQEEEEEV